MNTHEIEDASKGGPRRAEFADVDVSDAQGALAVDADAVRATVRAALAAEGVGAAEVSVAIVDDLTIHQVNRRFLAHDEPTDVISFTLSGPGDDALVGELVVSAETAARVARREGLDPWNELALYLVHGVLHLCGHDDLVEEARGVMRRREAEILASLGLRHELEVPDRTEGIAP